MIEAELKGYEEVKQALSLLPERLTAKVLKQAVGKSAAIVRNQLKMEAPVRKTTDWKRFKKSGAWFRGPGFLKRNIKSRYRRRVSTKYEAHYGVGPSGDAFYGYIVARGHIVGSRTAAKRKRSRGLAVKFVPAKDFITPVFNRMAFATTENLKKHLSEGIIREGKKLGFAVQ